jgi:hypothetical protein
MSQNVSNNATPLDYQPDSPSLRRKRFIFRTVIVIAMILGGTGAYFLGPIAANALITWHLYRHSLAYTAPPDRVVYEEDPLRGAQLAKKGYQLMSAMSPGWCHYWTIPYPSLARLSLPPTIVFMHARTSPGGAERLVLIWMASNGIRADASGASPDNQVRINLISIVCDGPHNCWDSFHVPQLAPMSLAMNRATPLYLRMFAGQPDRQDASRFTIAYQIGETSGACSKDNSSATIKLNCMRAAAQPRCRRKIRRLPSGRRDFRSLHCCESNPTFSATM